MSTGSLGFVGSLAGSPLAQTKGSEVTRAQHDSANQARQTDSRERTEAAEGIGKTDQDEQTSDRDADGRRLWEIGPDGKRRRVAPDSAVDAEPPQPAKDPKGISGNQLDLNG